MTTCMEFINVDINVDFLSVVCTWTKSETDFLFITSINEILVCKIFCLFLYLTNFSTNTAVYNERGGGCLNKF